MSYYTLLGLEREPFSTSPDPHFLFLSREHKAAYYRLQIAIRLRRGLSVLLGDVGTGKTTLSRALSRVLSDEEDVIFRMILNPYFESDRQFVARLASLFHVEVRAGATVLDHMEAVERFLFKAGVEQQRTPVLLIDEAQILPDFAFEILRILLNYETNDYKLLQLVLAGQMELLPRIQAKSNFWDRIALKYFLNPLDESEAQEMIEYRLRQAGHRGPAAVFTPGAVRVLWEHTQGYPRKLAMLCHEALEQLVMHDAREVDERTARGVVERDAATQGAWLGRGGPAERDARVPHPEDLLVGQGQT